MEEMVANDEAVITLEGNLTAYETPQLRDQFLGAFDTNKTLRVEWGEIEKVDSAGVQVFLSALRTAKESEITFEFGEPPEDLLRVCAAIGVVLPQDVKL